MKAKNLVGHLLALLTTLALAAGAGAKDVTFGGAGDGSRLVTDALQAAIDDVAASGGGRLTLPPGTYLSGGIVLKDSVTLHLAKGATLLGSTNHLDYARGSAGGLALVSANDATNVAIEGEGVIDGRGWGAPVRDYAPNRWMVCCFTRCRDVRVEGVTLTNPSFWTCRFKECDGVVARGVTIRSHANFNNDGFDVDAKNVLIEDCTVDTDDDAICFKSDNPNFTPENIAVRNCRLSSNCNFIKFGTASCGGFRNCEISHCTLVPASQSKLRNWKSFVPGVTEDVTGLAGIALEMVDGGVMENIRVHDVEMAAGCVQTPIFVRLGKRNVHASKRPSVLRDCVIENVRCDGTASWIASSITGVPGLRVQGLTLRNIDLTLKGGCPSALVEKPVPEKEKAYPENRMFDKHPLPGHAFYLRHADDVKFENVRTRVAGAAEARPPVVQDDCTGVTFANCAFGDDAPRFALGLSMNGNVRIGDTDATLAPTIFRERWSGVSTGARRDLKFPDAATGTAEVEFFGGKNEKFADGRITLRETSDGRAAFDATLTSARDQKPELVALVLRLPCAAFGNATWTTSGGKSGVLSKTWDGKAQELMNASVKWIEIAPRGRAAFRLEFPAPTRVQLNDDRRWQNTYSLRIWPADGSGRAFGAGAKKSFACTISPAKGAVSVSIDEPVVVKAGPDWIPLDYAKDIEAGSALDFSNQGLQDAPAGKYGWLKNVGGHFAFEKKPGAKQRFYGVNLCFDANFPDHDFADQLVTRLVRLGYNAVRVHHYESANGVVKGAADGLALNAERMDRLDYLLAKCFEKGIYVTTDFFTSRPVTWRAIGIDRDGTMNKQVYKNMILVHDGAFRNWAAFAKNLMTHVNPYTGRAYRDEPGLPFVSLINEGHLTWCWNEIRSEEAMKAAWAKWLAEKRQADPAFGKGCDDIQNVSIYSGVGISFMAEIERAGVRRMTDFLRKEVGVKALFTNQNCGGHYAPLLSVADELYDYVDDHFYVDHPQFLGKSWSLPSRCGNANPVLGGKLPALSCAFTRMPTKPFTITEWNFSGPGMFRGVGGIMTGAVAALQDWDGLWRFAYSHGLSGMLDRKGTPGYFDVATDPLGQAGDRASVCLFLRGDLAPLADGVAQLITPEALKATAASMKDVVPAWNNAAWQIRTATATKPAKGFASCDLKACFGSVEAPVALQENAAIALDRERGTFRIVTPKTAGGFAPRGAMRAGDVAFDVCGVPATVWASSLDGRPLAQSRRILVTHLTDVQADGNVYAEPAKKTLLKWGAYPPVVRNGQAKVGLAVADAEKFEVWALETSGRRAEKVPCEVRKGRLYFTANVQGPAGARMLYEVVRE